MTVSKEVQALIVKINKQTGAETIIFGSESKVGGRITSGSLALDVALGGGWPVNQWIEVVGQESHGKTAMVYKTLAANQATNPAFTCLWIAAEHYDTDQAEALGVDNERIIVVPTQEMEFAYETVLTFAKDRAVDMIVIDSYPALIPNEEDAKAMDESVMALGARLTGKFFRKAGSATKRSLTDPDDRPVTGFVINQFRDKIGGFSPVGTPQTTPGGNAKNYAYYVRVEVKRDEWIDEPRPGKGKTRVGQTIKVRTIKNKSAAPQQVATADFYFRDAPYLGFKRGDYDTVKETITMAVLFDVIERKGAWFQFVNGEEDPDGRPLYRWQGKEAMERGIRSEPALQEQIQEAVLEAARRPGLERTITEEDVVQAENAGTRKVSRRAMTEPDQEAA